MESVDLMKSTAVTEPVSARWLGIMIIILYYIVRLGHIHLPTEKRFHQIGAMR